LCGITKAVKVALSTKISRLSKQWSIAATGREVPRHAHYRGAKLLQKSMALGLTATPFKNRKDQNGISKSLRFFRNINFNYFGIVLLLCRKKIEKNKVQKPFILGLHA
jgi:hypothetical protein